MARQIIVCASLLVGFLAGSVLADDINPPPWMRGDPRTTYQDWTFALTDNPTPPDAGIANPYGIPVATITNGNWEQYYDNHVGVWDLGANSYIDVVVDNALDHPEYFKQLWIQMTWQGDLPSLWVDGLPGQLVETDPLGLGNWLHSTWLTTLPYNPPFETIHITGTTHLGEVVVDTICPEPATLSLLALGGLAMLRRKRR